MYLFIVLFIVRKKNYLYSHTYDSVQADTGFLKTGGGARHCKFTETLSEFKLFLFFFSMQFYHSYCIKCKFETHDIIKWFINY